MRLENKNFTYHSRRLAEAAQAFCAVAIVILSALAFLYQEEYAWTFPLVFLLAAVLNLSLGIYRLRVRRGEAGVRALSWLHCVFGGIMAVMCAVSTVMLWR